MVGLVGGALLEFAAAHLLPALVAEAGSLALRAAARGATRPGVPEEPGQPGQPERPRAPAYAPAYPGRAPGWRGRPALRLVPSASVLSHVPGRVRFRVAGLRGDRQRAEAIAGRLADVPGVLDATVSTVTGTALVHYDAARTGLAALQAAVEPPLQPAAPRPPRPPAAGRRRLRLVRP